MADAAFDLSFRRDEPEYQDRFFRVERNIVKNSTFYKTVGTVPGPCTLFFANNLFINAAYADYHRGAAEVVFVNNSSIFDREKTPETTRNGARRGSEGFACLWGYSGTTRVSNAMIFKPSGSFFLFYQNAEPPEDKFRFFLPDHNLYAVEGASVTWLRAAGRGVVFPTLEAWRAATSQDLQSVLMKGRPEMFTDYAADDFRPRAGAVPRGVSETRFLRPNDPRRTVDRDFRGVLRSTAGEIVPGAFCVPESPGNGSGGGQGP